MNQQRVLLRFVADRHSGNRGGVVGLDLQHHYELLVLRELSGSGANLKKVEQIGVWSPESEPAQHFLTSILWNEQFAVSEVWAAQFVSTQKTHESAMYLGARELEVIPFEYYPQGQLLLLQCRSRQDVMRLFEHGAVHGAVDLAWLAFCDLSQETFKTAHPLPGADLFLGSAPFTEDTADRTFRAGEPLAQKWAYTVKQSICSWDSGDPVVCVRKGDLLKLDQQLEHLKQSLNAKESREPLRIDKLAELFDWFNP